MPLAAPPMANMGQTKGGSPTHHGDHTIKVVYVARSCVTGASLWMQACGKLLGAKSVLMGPSGPSGVFDLAALRSDYSHHQIVVVPLCSQFSAAEIRLAYLHISHLLQLYPFVTFCFRK
ncbi:hypothetical protein D4764_17G0009500 [Takifugu flavidus]|uniref:Uncharacterized protein n=1 Tax=Takifugu flavidus TaxID=433684 RepID=A0A5C6P074_9TELE|nr:hypothetical protein D4764_17G0009500 [Takifugu flavidus]